MTIGLQNSIGGQFHVEREGGPNDCLYCAATPKELHDPRCPELRRERRQANLPRANRYSIPPRPGTVECKLCPSWVKPEGMADHYRAKHPGAVPV